MEPTPATEEEILKQVEIVFDLDDPEIEVVKIYPAKHSRKSGMGEQHIHEIFSLRINNNLHLAKSEDVYLSLRNPESLEYSNLSRFAYSIFSVGESSIPEVTFHFRDDPQIAETTFSRNAIEKHRELIDKIHDHTPPGKIETPLVRKLFLFYLSKKERLVTIGGERYDLIYSRYGRDIVNEVLATALGNILGIKVPQNNFGLKRSRFTELPEQKAIEMGVDHSRYLVSRCLGDTFPSPSLDLEMIKVMEETGRAEEAERLIGYNWHNANPLRLDSFSREVDMEVRFRADLVRENFPYYSDLIASDLLDHLLGACGDRNINEFLLPQGREGNIYTIDYGEALFPELQFEPGDPHYMGKHLRFVQDLLAYVDQITALPNGSIYSKTVLPLFERLFDLKEDFFSQLIQRIPKVFLQHNWKDSAPCYHPETLVSFFDYTTRTLRHKFSKIVKTHFSGGSPSKTEDTPSYTIAPNKKLIIVDAHDTILRRDYSRTSDAIFIDSEDKEQVTWMLRNGFMNFLDYYQGVMKLKVVISSDGGKQKLTQVATRFGIINQLAEIYGSNHMDQQTYLKKVGLILEDFEVDAKDAVFIGDSRIDRLSAEKHGVDFIPVPNTMTDPNFTFHRFLNLDFAGGSYGLELQKIKNLKRIHHNLPSSQLVETAVQRNEGKLVHLGALAVSPPEDRENRVNTFIVKEPSSEEKIYWEGEFKPFDGERFQLLEARILAFLQDREVYIQDCFAGADAAHRVYLRVLTQTAWHSLFVRNTFIQVPKEEQTNFFPEYTVLHLPYFKAMEEFDDIDGDSFILIHLLKKIAIIAGTHSSESIRRAVFAILSYVLPHNDIIPIRASSNRGKDGELAIFFGEGHPAKSGIALNQDRTFFGDDCHGWSKEKMFNMEWGCRVSVFHLSKEETPVVYEATRKFSSILENVALDPTRRPLFHSAETMKDSAVNFPISHIPNSDRNGVAPMPRHLFIFIRDGFGVIPTFSKLSAAQAVYFLLSGYGSKIITEKLRFGDYPEIAFKPFFAGSPFVFKPTLYAMLLLEKLERSKSDCWLINSSHLGHYNDNPKPINQAMLQQLVQGVYDGSIEKATMNHDEIWGVERVDVFENINGDSLNPSLAWVGNSLFKSWNQILLTAFQNNLEPYLSQLNPKIKDAEPPGKL